MHTNAGEPTIQIKYLPSLSTRHCSTRESVPHSGMILYLVVQNHHHFSFNWHSIELIQSRSQEMRLLKRFVCAFLRNGIGTTLLYYTAFFLSTHIYRAHFLLSSFYDAFVTEWWTDGITIAMKWMWSVPYFVSSHLKQYFAAHFSSSSHPIVLNGSLLMTDCFQFHFIATVSLSVSDHCITWVVRWSKHTAHGQRCH